MKSLLAGAVILGFMTTTAHAGLLLQESVNGGAFGTICSAASGGACSPGIVFTDSAGMRFTVLGATSNSPGTAVDSDLFQATVQVQNTSSATQNIVLRAGDTGFLMPTTPPDVSFINSISGTVTIGSLANLFSSDACVNSSNAQNSCVGGTSTPTINAAITAPGSGANSSTILVSSLNAPFSMTEILDITLGAGSTINFSASADVVPTAEPLGIALFGVGLVGLAYVSSRKHRRIDADGMAA